MGKTYTAVGYLTQRRIALKIETPFLVDGNGNPIEAESKDAIMPAMNIVFPVFIVFKFLQLSVLITSHQ